MGRDPEDALIRSIGRRGAPRLLNDAVVLRAVVCIGRLEDLLLPARRLLAQLHREGVGLTLLRPIHIEAAALPRHILGREDGEDLEGRRVLAGAHEQVASALLQRGPQRACAIEAVGDEERIGAHRNGEEDVAHEALQLALGSGLPLHEHHLLVGEVSRRAQEGVPAGVTALKHQQEGAPRKGRLGRVGVFAFGREVGETLLDGGVQGLLPLRPRRLRILLSGRTGKVKQHRLDQLGHASAREVSTSPSFSIKFSRCRFKASCRVVRGDELVKFVATQFRDLRLLVLVPME